MRRYEATDPRFICSWTASLSPQSVRFSPSMLTCAEDPVKSLFGSEQSVTKRFVPLLILFSFLCVSIVHACSGLDGMHILSLHNASNDVKMAGHPCDQKKRGDDLCKSVRHRLLSVKAEWAQNDLPLLPSSLPDTLNVTNLLSSAGLLGAPPRTAVLESLPESSPRSSHIVLRI